MAALGDVGEPPPLPRCIDSKLSLVKAIQRVENLAGVNRDAQGLGDIIRVNPQNAKVFDDFLNINKSHPLIANKSISS
jgi:hypothetical protein